MEKIEKTKEQLVRELSIANMRQRIAELEISLQRARQAEKALQRSEQVFRTLFEEAPLCYQSLDAAACLRNVNKEWLRTLGYSREEVLGWWFGDFMASPSAGHLTEWFSRVKADGGIRDAEFELIRNDGSRIAVSLSGTIGYDGLGNFHQVHCIFSDITVRKQAEKELRDGKNKYESFYNLLRLMCDNAPDLIWAKDRSRRYIFANRAICEKLLNAYDTDEPIGKTEAFFAEREKARSSGYPGWHTFGETCADSDAIVMESKKAGRFDEFGKVRGAPLYLDVYKAPFFNQYGEIIGTVGCGRVVTNEKRIEEERREAEERLRESEARELLKMQKLESVGILAGGIAHDFNNLLQAIMGNIALAKLFAHPSDRICDRLTEAEKSLEQAKELGSRLLTFAKGGEPVKTATPAAALLKEAVSLALSGSRILGEYVLPDDLYPLEIDREQISQVINNLVSNAMEAMPEGGLVRVLAGNVTVREQDVLPLKAGRYVKISIQDHGVGISEENLTRIFDPYFTTKEIGSRRGSGLGLAVCYSIVKKHDGLITVESRVGAGSTFHVYLPASVERGGGT